MSRPRDHRPVRAGFALTVMLVIVSLLASGPSVAGRDGDGGTGTVIASAEVWPEAVTLDELIRLTLEHSPVLAAQRSALAISEAQVLQAGLLPNPEIEYEALRRWRGVNPLDGREDEFVIQQPLLIAGQRRARVDTAEHELRAAQARFEVAASELVAEVRRAFVELLAYRQRIDYLEELRHDLARIEDNVAGRVEAGDKSPFDLMRLRIELAAFATELAQQRTERNEAAAALGELLGVAGWSPSAIGDLAPAGFALDAPRLWALAEGHLPDLHAAERAEVAAQSGIHLARRERIPVPTVGVGVLSVTEDRGRAAMLTFSVDLPLFDRGQGMMAEAVAEARTAQLEHASERVRARARFERTLRLLQDRRATLVGFETEVLEQIPGLRERAEDAYLLGQIDIIGLLDAFESLADARMTGVDLREAVMQAEVDVLEATGQVTAP